MKTVFEKNIGGRAVSVQMKETTNSLWLSVGTKDHGKQSDVHAIASLLWDRYQIDIRGSIAREIYAVVDAASNPNPAPQPEPRDAVAEALISGDINKYASGGA